MCDPISIAIGLAALGLGAPGVRALTREREEECSSCEGSGQTPAEYGEDGRPDSWERCSSCGGRGKR